MAQLFKMLCLGVNNPFRYRGYYYDVETGLYYLNARYYNPHWGRFINADSYGGTVGGLLSHNAFMYCMNNPIMYCDPSGYTVYTNCYVSGGVLYYSYYSTATGKYYYDYKEAYVADTAAQLPADEREVLNKAVSDAGMDKVTLQKNANGTGFDIIVDIGNTMIYIVLTPISAVKFINNIRGNATATAIASDAFAGGCGVVAVAFPPSAPFDAVVGGLVALVGNIDAACQNSFADALEQNYAIEMNYTNTNYMSLIFSPQFGFQYIHRIP